MNALGGAMEMGQNMVQGVCCDCWTGGCGCDAGFGLIADGLEAVNPVMETIADFIWILGSPLAFPIIFCFPAGEETEPPNGGWLMPMIQTPCRRPCHCLFYTGCTPCGQWHMRRKALNYDMTKYKLWQGYHDGPQCCARMCPGMPITIEAGTYGEEKCPNFFLCLEVWCLAGFWSTCCAFDVTRRMIKHERNLVNDPTEVRINKCIGFFSRLARNFCACACCMCCTSLLVECCAPDSAGAQECSGETGRAARALFRCVRTCWRGIWSVKIIAIGCMSTQQDHELTLGEPLASKPAVVQNQMERGDDANEADDADDDWWKKNDS